MASHRVYLGRLTIPNGDDQSNVLSSRQLAMASAIIFYNAAAYTGTVTVVVGAQEDMAIGDLKPLGNNGAAVDLTADTVERFDISGFLSIAVDSDQNEAAERVIEVYAILDLASE